MLNLVKNNLFVFIIVGLGVFTASPKSIEVGILSFLISSLIAFTVLYFIDRRKKEKEKKQDIYNKYL